MQIRSILSTSSKIKNNIRFWRRGQRDGGTFRFHKKVTSAEINEAFSSSPGTLKQAVNVVSIALLF
jgi:hypothetical protein